MIEKSAGKMTSLLIKKKLISEDRKEMYQYSFELLISALINLLLVLLLGLLFHAFLETLVFLFFFCPLKRYTGGFHMPGYGSCITFFGVLYTALLSFHQFCDINVTFLFLLSVLVSAAFIARFSPIESKHKKLSNKEKKALSRKAIILLLSDILLFVLFYFLSYMQITKFMGFALIVTAILMAGGLLQNHWEVRHD